METTGTNPGIPPKMPLKDVAVIVSIASIANFYANWGLAEPLEGIMECTSFWVTNDEAIVTPIN